MKIAVLGAGAMGSLFGGLLSEAGHEVWLVDIWEEHIRAINERGLVLTGASGQRTLRDLRAVTAAEEAGKADLVIVFVKSTSTEAAVKGACPLFGTDTLVLTLQNGLGNIERISSVVPISMIIAGTTAQGATVLGPGEIFHAGKGLTMIGELDGPPTPRVEKIARAFNEAGIETGVSDNVVGLIWGKLLVNVGINALTAILRMKNGEILNYPEAVEILEMAVKEATVVAMAKGITLPYEDPVSHTKEIALATSGNRSSMLQDVTNRRKTEIEMINGAIVREGEALGIPTPVNRVLVGLVRAMEERYLAGEDEKKLM